MKARPPASDKDGAVQITYSLCTRVLCINTREPKSKVFACFVDFRRCFDSVSHSVLWNHLHKVGISTKLIKTIKSLDDKAKVSVNNYELTEEIADTNENLEECQSEKVKLTVGLMQGDGLSPLLYMHPLHIRVSRIFEEEWNRRY